MNIAQLQLQWHFSCGLIWFITAPHTDTCNTVYGHL